MCVCPELELTESVAQSREMQRRGGGGGDSLLLTPSVLIMDFFWVILHVLFPGERAHVSFMMASKLLNVPYTKYGH